MIDRFLYAYDKPRMGHCFKRRTKILIYWQTMARLRLKIGFIVYF